jgi:hypothetical protein
VYKNGQETWETGRALPHRVNYSPIIYHAKGCSSFDWAIFFLLFNLHHCSRRSVVKHQACGGRISIILQPVASKHTATSFEAVVVLLNLGAGRWRTEQKHGHHCSSMFFLSDTE